MNFVQSEIHRLTTKGEKKNEGEYFPVPDISLNDWCVHVTPMETIKVKVLYWILTLSKSMVYCDPFLHIPFFFTANVFAIPRWVFRCCTRLDQTLSRGDCRSVRKQAVWVWLLKSQESKMVGSVFRLYLSPKEDNYFSIKI